MKNLTSGLLIWLVIPLACWAQAVANSEFRIWTTVDGKKSSVRLKLISKDNDSVRLKREDNGREITLPLSNLSTEDRRFLAANTSRNQSVTSTASQENWPCFRGPNRNGISNARLDLLNEPKQLWKFSELGSRYRGSAAIVDGKLFINGGRVNRAEPLLYCLDANTGELIWKVPGGRTHSTPVVQDGRIFTVDDRNHARCFDSKTGDLIWKSEPLPESSPGREYGHAGSPLIHDDLLILNYGGGVALHVSDGTVVWQHEGFAGLATPVAFNHRGTPAVAIFGGDRLIARTAQTGDSLWSIEREAGHGVNACDPIFIENDTKVFVSSSYAKSRAMYDLTGDTPEEIWSMGAGSSYSTGIYVDGNLYGMAGGFGRINLKTGRRETRGPGAASVLRIDGKWVFLDGGGKLEIGTLENGKFDSQMETQVLDGQQTWNTPAYWQGKLYVRGEQGSLVCLQIGK